MTVNVEPSVLSSVSTDGSIYGNTAFNQILTAELTPNTVIFEVGSHVKGQTSNARGIVAFSNGTHIGLVGDKNFVQQETITNGTLTANIYINTFGTVYAKDLNVLYIENLADVHRSNTQSEAYRLIIKV